MAATTGRSRVRRLLGAVAAAALAASCSTSAADGIVGPEPTPTPVPAPEIIVRSELRTRPGVAVDAAVIVVSHRPPVRLELVEPVAGVTLDDDVLRWHPAEATTRSVGIRALDADGREAVAELALVARHPARSDLLVALGDSVASGHGLELRDYLGGDPCWRSTSDSYPAVARTELVARGSLEEGTSTVLAACSGARAGDLMTEPVDASPTVPGDDGGDRPQVEWAVLANPGVITLTVGANDLGFVDPAALFVPGPGGSGVDWDTIGLRLDEIGYQLDLVLERLVDATDALVAVTGYYDPTAPNPHGIAGCVTSCFAAASASVVAELNAVIEQAAARYPDRVVFVPLAQGFVGHEAPNGLGPDGLRAGLGPLGGVVGGLVGGVHPYCAKGPGGPEPWISAVDCVHPNAAGARAIGVLVADAIAPMTSLGGAG